MVYAHHWNVKMKIDMVRSWLKVGTTVNFSRILVQAETKPINTITFSTWTNILIIDFVLFNVDAIQQICYIKLLLLLI